MFVNADLRLPGPPGPDLERAARVVEAVLLEQRTTWPPDDLADRVRALGLLADLVHQALISAVADADGERVWALEGDLHPVPWLCRQAPLSSTEALRLLRAARLVRAHAAGRRARGAPVPPVDVARRSA